MQLMKMTHSVNNHTKIENTILILIGIIFCTKVNHHTSTDNQMWSTNQFICMQIKGNRNKIIRKRTKIYTNTNKFKYTRIIYGYIGVHL